MSIQDDNGTQIVTLNTLHAMAFRVLIWVGIIATPTAAGMFWSMANKLSVHEERLQFHEWRLNTIESHTAGKSATYLDNDGYLHGMASQVGKVPGRVAAKIENNAP